MVSEAANVSGFFFNVDGNGPIKWDLWIGEASDKDWSKREPHHVKIGKSGEHPSEIPFQTFGHPDKKGHGH
jgi:hypothetical protein